MKCKSYISGNWVNSTNDQAVSMFNPADTNQKICEVEFADAELVFHAIESAKSAFVKWKSIPTKNRVEYLKEFLDLSTQNRQKLAETITLENGKTLNESHAEISSGISEANYQLDYFTDISVETKNLFETRHEPLGPVLLITPWNFPFATVMRKMIPALAAGNSVILKPSELTPMTSVFISDILSKVSLPDGTVNTILGDGRVGSFLTGSSDIKAISLTGSTITGKHIKKQIAEGSTRFQAEMGGKNCVAVLPDADVEKAAKDIIINAYACCGQWCTGTSRVVVHKDVSRQLIDFAVDLTKLIKLGNGLVDQTNMGPLISQAQLDKVISFVAQAEKANLSTGGKKPDDLKLLNGYFFEPTIFSGVNSNSKLAQEEIFGPVLSIMIEDSIEDMISTVNNSKYGLSFSVYTQDEIIGEKFINEIEAGLCHINLPTAYRDPSLPLLGWKDSGFGLPGIR
ncbi:MAG: aldehyde dehydrogenase family protein [Melioribacteraceae bacterium]|nr:aldehyde dehydrogenase family protein [Melioribacteraceae bacterium]